MAGCSIESVAERSAACQSTDWTAYGVTDGRLGVPAGERADYFKRCRELGVAVDEAAYQIGRARGLQEYCTADNGYRVGRDGARYDDVCTGPDEVAFLQGYEAGRKARPGVSPSIGLGLGIGSHHTHGGIGIGFPIWYGSHYYHDWPRHHHYHRSERTRWHPYNRRSQ